ncbi:MAG: ABC transporter ATP-binding protein [Oryzihumus sp.]
MEVRDLSVDHGGVPALQGVDLQVSTGEVLALLGPSGSGKSTLLDTVAGFVQPRSGTVLLGGRVVAGAGQTVPPERRDVAVVFQQNALWPHLSAVDTVAYPLRRRGVPREAARRQAAELLGRLHVGHLAARRPAELSGGEQQRVGLARALARGASLYLFDEPTAHLDTHVRDVFLQEMAERQRATGAAAVYSSHDAAEALALADRVALLDASRVVQVGTPQDVYDHPVHEWAARITGPGAVLDLPEGRVLVRPEWAAPDGPEPGRLVALRYRGPWTDLVVETAGGELLLREPGYSPRSVGEPLTWRLLHRWVLPGAADQARAGVVPQPSTASGPG